MNKFAQVRDLVMSLEDDFDKFYDKKNQAAGTRVRKGLQDLKTLSQDIRLEVQNIKNAAVEENKAAAPKKDAAATKPAAKAAPKAAKGK